MYGILRKTGSKMEHWSADTRASGSISPYGTVYMSYEGQHLSLMVTVIYEELEHEDLTGSRREATSYTILMSNTTKIMLSVYAVNVIFSYI